MSLKTSRKDFVSWIDRHGRTRESFHWKVDDDKARDACGLDLWEQAGFFGPYRVATHERALELGRGALDQRGFDPATAESLIPWFKSAP